MKIDKRGKQLAKLFGFTMWSIFLFLYGGLYPPWVPETSLEGKVWITAFTLIWALSGAALTYLTEESK